MRRVAIEIGDRPSLANLEKPEHESSWKQAPLPRIELVAAGPNVPLRKLRQTSVVPFFPCISTLLYQEIGNSSALVWRRDVSAFAKSGYARRRALRGRGCCIDFDWHGTNPGVPSRAGPLPIFCQRHQSSSHWVRMNVLDHLMSR